MTLTYSLKFTIHLFHVNMDHQHRAAFLTVLCKCAQKILSKRKFRSVGVQWSFRVSQLLTSSFAVDYTLMGKCLFYVFVYHHEANTSENSEPVLTYQSITLALTNCKILYLCSKHGFPLTKSKSKMYSF